LDEWKNTPKEQKSNGRFVRGKGIAAFMKSPVMATSAPSMCQLKFNEDCSVNMQVSATDMGQGSITALSQIASEVLQIPVDKIKLSSSTDTERHPYDWQTVASRTTWMAGNATIIACQKAILQMKEMAVYIWKLKSIDEVQYDGTNLYGPMGLTIPIKSLVMGYVYPDGEAIGGPVTGIGYFLPPGVVYHDPETGQGNAAAEYTFGCQGFDISIDTLTGEIKVNKMVTAIDAGKVINPSLARGQIIGAMVQGFGGAYLEEIRYSSEGKIRNDNLTDYKIPTAEDIADTEFNVIFLENPQHDGPFGARPIAEHAVVAIAPAFANALRDAAGLQFFHLPVTSDKILVSLRKGNE
jgi:carbon-monoxide dehydrogenase large subunit